MWAVELESVSARYADDDGVRLSRVDLQLAPGRITALLGPNGAGKSTLIRVVSGRLPVFEGRVSLLGDPLEELAAAERARRVAVVPQRSEVAFGFTVREVVAMGRAPHQGGFMRETGEDAEAIAAAIATCQLDDLAARPVSELSGGEQKRVHIARALAQQAPLLLLDEAAAHLDIRHALQLYDVVRRQVESLDLACLMTTHDLAAASTHADDVVLLKDGQVVARGSVDEVMAPEPLEAAFGVAVEVGHHADGRRYFLPEFPPETPTRPRPQNAAENPAKEGDE